jgi:hypothetical protein
VNTFHLSDEALAAYCQHRCGAVERASTEAHLLACDACRRAFAARYRAELVAGDGADLDQLWDRVLRSVEDEPAGRPARILRRTPLREADGPVVRAIAAGAAEWTLAATVVVAVAALAAGIGGLARSWVPFVVLAPLWPPLGVAATYRFGARPLAPFEATAPYPAARLLLWRTAYVLVTSVPLTVGFGALIGGRGWLWASWLLPSLVCTLVVVIAATWVDPVRPALAVGAVWAVAVALSAVERGADPLTSEQSLQVACAASALVGAAVLVRRLRHLKEMTMLEVRP